jgi:hypothetical protein
VGNKELSEDLEVRGYATAADWVYGYAIEPHAWTAGGLITLAEVGYVHTLAMTPVWHVAPHSQATDRRARAHSASTTSRASPEACARRRGQRSVVDFLAQRLERGADLG